MIKNSKIFQFILIIMVFIFAVTVSPAKSETDTLDVCISGNFWLPGTINVEGFDADKSGGLLFRGFVDSLVAEKLTMGAFLNLAPSVEVEEESASMYEIGGSLKYRAMAGEMPLKIGINIGYRKMDSDIIDDEVEGLGINLSAELQFNTQGSFVPFIEAGFLTQPSGGNEDAEVTWSPIVYFGGGVAF